MKRKTPKNKDENAKNPDWQVPMTMEGVKPYSYDINTDTSGGSQLHPDDTTGKPYGSGAADPAGKDLKKVTAAVRRLARQKGISG